MNIAQRAQEVAAFLAMDVMERGFELSRAGHHIVQLGVGEPDFPPPPAVVHATQEAVASGYTHYTDSRGLHALRQAIVVDCKQRRGVDIHPDQVLVTSGTSPAMLLLFQLLLEPRDEVLLPTPHYPCYAQVIRLCGGVPVLVPCRAEDGYQIDPARVRNATTARTRALVLASPANPTGAVQTASTVEALCELGLPIISDEIYDGLLYDGVTVRSPLGRAPACFVLDGFSKRYAMTGYRLGYVIIDAKPAVSRSLQRMAQNLFISANHFCQQAAITALEAGAEHLAMMRNHYTARRERLVSGLRALGFGVHCAPQGAFYVLADARRWGQDSLSLAFQLLERAHVATGPGLDFGATAEGHLRFSFCASEDAIEAGLGRLAQVLPGLRPQH